MTDTKAEAAAPEADPQACRSCATTSRSCIEGIDAGRGACCGACSLRNTHGTTAAADGAELADVRSAEPGTEVVQADGLQAALMAAAEAGAGQGMATIPAVSEFAHLCQVARLLSMSAIAPEKVRGRPYDALLIILTARDLGIPITSGLRKISIIEGQPSIDTELQIALVRQRGYGAVLPIQENFTQEPLRFAGAQAVGPNGQPMGPMVLFTWEDAVTAGYVDGACLPEAHDRRRVTKGSGDRQRTFEGCLCKDNWKTVPRDMLWWRAAARARRIYFPEATTGMYDADELGGVIDVEGRLVDPTTAPLPDGYVDPQEQRQQQAAAADQRGDPDDLLDLWLRSQALPTEVRNQMRAAWKENDRIQGRPMYALPARLVKLAKSMLTGWEASAKRADKTWDRDREREMVREEVGYQVATLLLAAFYQCHPPAPAGTEPAAAPEPEPVTAAEEPQEPSEPAAGTPAAPEATEAQGDDQGPASDDAEPEPEPDEPDRDWSPELRRASDELARLVKEAAPYVADTIGQAVRGMSWQAVNKALTEAGQSIEGPIDLRRMRLSIHRFMEYEEPF